MSSAKPRRPTSSPLALATYASISAVFTAWSSFVRPPTMLDADRIPAPRRRGPGDGPRVVVGLVLPQALEHAPAARDARAPLPGVVGEPPAERQLVAAHLVQVRIDPRLRGGRHATLPLDEVEGST